MEFTCVYCGGKVQDGQCEECHEVYITHCPRCGNSLAFEQIDIEGEAMLRCANCENDSNLELVSVNPI